MGPFNKIRQICKLRDRNIPDPASHPLTPIQNSAFNSGSRSPCKQSLRLTLPKLNPIIKFEPFLKSVTAGNRKFIAYCLDNAIHLKDAYHGGFDITVVIGPEGDFSGEEIARAQQNEFEVVSLGKSRLRLETAALFVTSIFNLSN